MFRNLDLSCYVITDKYLSRGRSHLDVVEQAISGGATCVQLREKDITSRDFFLEAEQLRKLTADKGVLFIVNDRLDIALAVGADGVHLGQEDIPVSAARRIIPPEMILGVSVDNVYQARKAQSLGASYLGAGAVFATGTKADAGEPMGLKVLSSVCHQVNIPVVGIGGINAGNARKVIEAGAAGVAVISSIVAADDITRAAKEIAREVEEAFSFPKEEQS